MDGLAGDGRDDIVLLLGVVLLAVDPERDRVGGGVRHDGRKRRGKRDGKEDKGKVQSGVSTRRKQGRGYSRSEIQRNGNKADEAGEKREKNRKKTDMIGHHVGGEPGLAWRSRVWDLVTGRHVGIARGVTPG